MVCIPSLTVVDFQCPHCQGAVRILKERPSATLTCPTCKKIMQMKPEDFEKD